MFYIFDGDDEFSRQEEVAALRSRLGPADMLSLNTSRFDGKTVSFEELRHACDTIPFLAESRLVIAEGLLTHLQGRSRTDKGQEGAEGVTDEPRSGDSGRAAFRKHLLEYLPALPESTHLVFVEPAKLPPKDPFVRLTEAHPELGKRKFFTLPNIRRSDGRAHLATWIRQRAKQKGASIEPAAVNALTELVGNNLRQLDSELEKLALYCEEGSITLEAVTVLVSLARETVVWDLVNALNQRDLEAAMETLRRLFEEGQAPLQIFALIVREYRILIQVKTLLAQGATHVQIASRLGLQPWAVERAERSARSASPEHLRQTYHTFLEVDTAIKTGLQQPEAALEFLVASLCR